MLSFVLMWVASSRILHGPKRGFYQERKERRTVSLLSIVSTNVEQRKGHGGPYPYPIRGTPRESNLKILFRHSKLHSNVDALGLDFRRVRALAESGCSPASLFYLHQLVILFGLAVLHVSTNASTTTLGRGSSGNWLKFGTRQNTTAN